MSRTYITAQGDMWDSIAHSELGSVAHTGNLLMLNPGYVDYYIFPSGIALVLPDINAAPAGPLPPWKQVAG